MDLRRLLRYRRKKGTKARGIPNHHLPIITTAAFPFSIDRTVTRYLPFDRIRVYSTALHHSEVLGEDGGSQLLMPLQMITVLRILNCYSKPTNTIQEGIFNTGGEVDVSIQQW